MKMEGDEVIAKSYAEKHYNSAKKRFLEPVIEKFFEVEFPTQYGPIIRKKLASELTKMIDDIYPEKERVKPGQMVWSAIDKNTSYCSDKVNFKPVILTLTCKEDIEDIVRNEGRIAQVRPKIIARLCNEAYAQGALLSMRDIGLMMAQNPSSISTKRKEYEEKQNTVLPHIGSLQDCGTTLTHKKIIINKIVKEKQDPKSVAASTNHSQKAVDNYLMGYRRISFAREEGFNAEQIHFATGYSINLIKQYEEIYNEINC